MKRYFLGLAILALFLVLVLPLSFVSSEEVSGQIEGTSINSEQDIQDRLDNLGTSRDEYLNNPKKWEYFGEKLKAVFFSYPAFIAFDSFMSQISVLFLIFIGMEYSFSFDFLIALFAGIFLLVNMGILLKYAPPMDKFRWAFSILIVLILARVSFFFGVVLVVKGLFNTLGTIIKAAVWLIPVFIAIFVFAMLFLQKLILAFRDYLEKKAEVLKKIVRESDEAILHDTAKGLSNAFEKKNFSSYNEVIDAINSSQSLSDAEKIRRSAAKTFHPDVGGSVEDMSKINSAFDDFKRKFRK